MQEEAILIGISQLGGVFAGFISIFLVFARKDGRFSRADSLRVRALLYGSFSVVVTGVLPLIMAGFGFEGRELWRVSAAACFAFGSVSTLDVARHHIALTCGDKIEVGILHSFVTWGLNFLTMVLLIVLIAGFGGWGFYLLALALILAITMINFLTITLQRLL